MHLAWALHPIAQTGLLAVGLGACVYLFITLELEMRSVRIWQKKIYETLEVSLTETSASMKELEGRLREVEERSGTVLTPVPKSGLNFSKRSQALRMHRRGDTAEQIALALGLPRNEVTLLLKVHRIVLQHY